VTGRDLLNFFLVTCEVIIGFAAARYGHIAIHYGGVLSGLISAIAWGGSATVSMDSSRGWNVVAAVSASMTLGFAPVN
jgi:hypothetical protein